MTKINKSGFESCLGQTFEIQFGDQAVDAELIEVTGINTDTTQQGRKEPFSAVFRALDKNAYSQGTFLIKNNTLGENAVFLVPIGPDEIGMCYEAVFA